MFFIVLCKKKQKQIYNIQKLNTLYKNVFLLYKNVFII